MDTKILIDAIVHNTTLLIAQLSTAAGIRAPLAHIADQVFVELSREIEAQGVSRKVAADMFGLAIRTYQKKVQRLTESVSVREATLWQAVLDRVDAVHGTSRREILDYFAYDDPLVVSSVLADLVSSGLVERTGTGDAALFDITPERDRARAVREHGLASLTPVVGLLIYRKPGITQAELQSRLQVDAEAVSEALALLVAEGQIQRTGPEDAPSFRASKFLIPVGAEHGWEAAVFDHFQTVVRAISSKVRRGVTRSANDAVVGGATLGFDIHQTHPHKQEVLDLLKRVRADVNGLWAKVQHYNDQNPIPEEDRIEVSFYFGQCVTWPDQE
jgi:hypothetical protein